MRFVLLEAPTAEATPAEDTTQQTATDTQSGDDSKSQGAKFDPNKLKIGSGMNDEFVRGLISMNDAQIDRIIGLTSDRDRESFLYKNLSPTGKTFVDSMTRLIEGQSFSPEEIFGWLERNKHNLSVIKSKKDALRLFFLTGKLFDTAGSKLLDVYLSPELWSRSDDDFEYSCIIIANVSSPVMRKRFFRGNKEVSVDGLMNGGKLKPAGIDLRKEDGGETIYGQVQAWGKKNTTDKFSKFSEATKKLKRMSDGGNISNGTRINIDGLYKFKDGKWSEYDPNSR